MGRVFRAEHATLGRQVAIKVLRPELARDLGCMQRFFAEARAVNQIRSEHLVEVTDLCRDPGGDTYLVMELLEGMDLYDLQASTQLSLRRSLLMMRQLCETLDEVHKAGVVHRDLKPENVFITQREGCDFVKLLDFGVAKHSDVSSRSVRMTAPGILLGTPQYMAPEQATGEPVDPRTDIYALGVILFQLMTDRLPFQSSNLNVLLHDIACTRAPSPSHYVSLPESIRRPMDALVRRCLHKNPAARPQSAMEVASALDAMLSALGDDDSMPDVRAGRAAPVPLLRAVTAPSELRAVAPVSEVKTTVHNVLLGIATAAALLLFFVPRAGNTATSGTAVTESSTWSVPASVAGMSGSTHGMSLQVRTEPLDLGAIDKPATAAHGPSAREATAGAPRSVPGHARPSRTGQKAQSRTAKERNAADRASSVPRGSERRPERLQLQHRDAVINPFATQ